MATFVPQHNSRSAELGVEDKNNMYTTATSNTYGYVFYLDDLYGFPQYNTFYIDLEFDITLPQTAVVDSISTVLVKGRQNNVVRGTDYIQLRADDRVLADNVSEYFSSGATTLSLGAYNTPNLKYITSAERVYMRIPYKLNVPNVNGDLFIYGAQFTLTYFVPAAYVKENGVWKPVKTAYKKISNAWSPQIIRTVFDPNTHYEKGE